MLLGPPESPITVDVRGEKDWGTGFQHSFIVKGGKSMTKGSTLLSTFRIKHACVLGSGEITVARQLSNVYGQP